jgi:hypothetical protein
VSAVYEHWTDEVSSVFFGVDYPDDRLQHLTLSVGAPTYCCTITAHDFDEALAQYHEHQGWKPYRPMDDQP